VSVTRALDEVAKAMDLSKKAIKNFRDEINRGRANARAQAWYDSNLTRLAEMATDSALRKNVKSGR
jgi:hypothetical protein